MLSNLLLSLRFLDIEAMQAVASLGREEEMSKNRLNFVCLRCLTRILIRACLS